MLLNTQATNRQNLTMVSERTAKTAYKISAEIALSKTTWRDVELGANDLKLSTMWKVAEGLDIPLEKLISEVNATLGEDFSLADIK